MPPRWLTPVPAEDVARGKGRQVGEFIEAMCETTKQTFSGPAGSPFQLLQWQWDLLGRLYAVNGDGRRRHRVALIGVPRKNGKSGLGAGLALYHLLCEGRGAQVYSAAADRLQAKIVFGEAAKMVKANPELDAMCKVWRDVIEVTSTGSIYRALSSEAYTQEGLDASAVIVDEVHALPRRDLWDVLAHSQGARVDPIMVGITTAGVRTDVSGGESLCYSMFQYLREVASGSRIDDTFYGEWWASDLPLEDDQGDIDANPSIGVLLDAAEVKATKLRAPEADFLTKRRNLFVATASHWFPEGVFEGLQADIDVADRPVVLAFDGSWTQDSTAIIGCTADGTDHLFAVKVWNRPRDAAAHWHVPDGEVLETFRQSCQDLNVVEITADPSWWHRQLGDLRAEGYPVTDFSQQSEHMVKATAGFQQAVVDGDLTHDGDPSLVLHVRNSHVQPQRGGVKIQKDAKNSTRKIDSAVAAVMARWRARWHAERPQSVRGIFVS